MDSIASYSSLFRWQPAEYAHGALDDHRNAWVASSRLQLFKRASIKPKRFISTSNCETVTDSRRRRTTIEKRCYSGLNVTCFKSSIRECRQIQRFWEWTVNMKIDSAQPLYAPSGAQGVRVSDGSAGNLFSTAMHEATVSNIKTKAPSGSLSPPNQSPNVLSLFQPARRASFNERALGLRAYRQELLASNIANADTPGYKAVDIDINEALRTGKSKDDAPLLYRMPAQGSVDGNTVDMDVERAEFSQNAVMYEYTVDRVRGYYKMMDDLLKNTPY
ncbi:conserved hypothetical protein [Ricinus communis]|uniref:Flagellar basal body rod protein N-terminal domain-containing protein n=1 Tax=Ricinus communis TaxID=3988 RepID=B9TBW7_RICCO|nr:conserved hypothetical protein [Ricinus communis]